MSGWEDWVFVAFKWLAGKVISETTYNLSIQDECQSAQMSKIKNGELDQYGAEPFEQQTIVIN